MTNNFLVRNRFWPLISDRCYYSCCYTCIMVHLTSIERKSELNGTGWVSLTEMFSRCSYKLCTWVCSWVCLLRILMHTFFYLLSGWPYSNASQWKYMKFSHLSQSSCKIRLMLLSFKSQFHAKNFLIFKVFSFMLYVCII